MHSVYIILLVASSVSESMAFSPDVDDHAVIDTKGSRCLMQKALASNGVMEKGIHETRSHEDVCIANLSTLMNHLITQHQIPETFEGGTDDAEFIEEQQAVQEVGAKKICETGFNAGVSSLAWLCSSPDTIVYSFDIGQWPYVPIARDYLQAVFGQHRLTLTLGDSTQTIPQAIQAKHMSCDVAFVDGGHTEDVALRDMRNFKNMTKPNGRLLVENCNAQGQANGWGGMPSVNHAYQLAIKEGVIQHERQISTAGCSGPDLTKCREICVAHYI